MKHWWDGSEWSAHYAPPGLPPVQQQQQQRRVNPLFTLLFILSLVVTVPSALILAVDILDGGRLSVLFVLWCLAWTVMWGRLRYHRW